MDLASAYDAPYVVKLYSSAYGSAVAEIAAKQAARDAALRDGDANKIEAARNALLESKKAFISLGESAVTSLSFPRLEWNQILELAAKLKKSAEDSILARCSQLRLTPWEQFRALRELDVAGIQIPAIIRYAGTPEGADEICRQQAQKAGFTSDEINKILKAIGPTGRANLALELVSAADIQPPRDRMDSPNPL